MPAWYYYTIYKCPDCGATYEQYDHTAPWCDSGLTSPPVIEQRCDECFEEVQKQDLTEEACEMLESAATYLKQEDCPDWEVKVPVAILENCQKLVESGGKQL